MLTFIQRRWEVPKKQVKSCVNFFSFSIFFFARGNNKLTKEEAILALRSLGFKVKEIEEVLHKLPVSLSMEELIRESLRRLRK